MFLSSAFISAARSMYYYLAITAKRNSDDKTWLAEKEREPAHEIAKQLRDFMLHEATPDAGMQVPILPALPGETPGEAVVRSLFSPTDAQAVITIADALPKLSPEARRLLEGKTTVDLFHAIDQALHALVREAEDRGMLPADPSGVPRSTRR